MKIHPFYERTSKRRKGFPSETRVGKEPESCMGTNTSWKKSAAEIHVHAVPDAGFKNCCLRSGRYDGVLRNHYDRE